MENDQFPHRPNGLVDVRHAVYGGVIGRGGKVKV